MKIIFKYCWYSVFTVEVYEGRTPIWAEVFFSIKGHILMRQLMPKGLQTHKQQCDFSNKFKMKDCYTKFLLHGELKWTRVNAVLCYCDISNNGNTKQIPVTAELLKLCVLRGLFVPFFFCTAYLLLCNWSLVPVVGWSASQVWSSRGDPAGCP